MAVQHSTQIFNLLEKLYAAFSCTIRSILYVMHMLLSIVGVYGQSTIIADPMGPYVVGQMLTLSCSPSFINESTMYSWSCSPSCFADVITTQNISRTIMSEDHGVMLTCNATTGDLSEVSTVFQILGQLS